MKENNEMISGRGFCQRFKLPVFTIMRHDMRDWLFNNLFHLKRLVTSDTTT
jgi:hypothetical protein